MFETKFIKLFLQLNRKEKQNLKLWVHSPIGNARKDVAALFDFIYSKRTINEQNASKEEAFNFVYHKRKYNEQEMRYLMSFAVQCAEEFLIFYHQQQEEFHKELLLASIYNQKNIPLYPQQQINKAADALNKSVLKNNDSYLHQFQFAVQQYNIQSKNKRYEN